MAFLDAYVPQIHKSSANFTSSTEMLHHIIDSAEQQAQSAQAFNKGEHGAAFQAAHSRFITAATKVKMLMQQASDHIQKTGATYTQHDSQAAHDISQTVGDSF